MPKHHKFSLDLFKWGGLFALAYACFSLVGIFSLQANDLEIPPVNVSSNVCWFLVYIVTFLLYIIFLEQLLATETTGKPILKKALFFTALFSILLVIPPPFGSIDVNNYAMAARTYNFYGLNPYLVSTADILNDPYFEYTFDNINPYGPLFTILLILADLIAGQNFFFTTVILKLLMVGFLLASTLVLYKILLVINLKKAKIYSIVFAWNPLVLFEVANNGHNDIMILFFTLLAFYLLLRKSYFWIIPLLTISVLIKYVTVLIVPFFMIYIVRHKCSFAFWRRVLLTCTLVVCLSYYPFLKNDLSMFKGLLRQFSQSEYWFHYGAIPLLAFWGNHTFSLGLSTGLLKTSFQLVFLISYVSLYFQKISTELKVSEIIFKTYLAYFVIACFWMMPWYFLWILPLPLFFAQNYWKPAILLLTLAGLLSHFVPVGGFLLLLMGIYLFRNRLPGIEKYNAF